MSGGLEILWDNFVMTEQNILLRTFGFSQDDKPHIRSRLAYEGSRLALAGDKIYDLFICEFSPNPIYTGEFISFFGSNMVMTAYVTDFLELPFDYRPGVNPLRLGDMFMAFLSLSCLTRNGFQKMTYVTQLENLDRAREICGKVVRWVLRDRKVSDVTLDELRRDVQNRAKESKEERLEVAKKMIEESLTCAQYNEWRKDESVRPLPPLKSRHPVVRIKFMTRSGQERQLFACMCCSAIEPKDCKCIPLEKLVGKTERARPQAPPGTRKDYVIDDNDQDDNHQQQQQQQQNQMFFGGGGAHSTNPFSAPSVLSAAAITNKNNQNNQNTNNNNKISDSLSLSFKMKEYQLPRFHFGALEECRLTKTKALKVQNIAVWSCCGAAAAKVNTTPIGYEVTAEHENGCCGPSPM